MQFFFLLLFNIFLGAVLYLVISLKLERSATEFRERRLRKEMDEIIKEFNVTAERNISILERRIRVLRRLLEQSGAMKSLDITLNDEEPNVPPDDSLRGEPANRRVDLKTLSAENEQIEQRERNAENNAGELIKKGLLLFFKQIKLILPIRGSRSGGKVADREQSFGFSRGEMSVQISEQNGFPDGVKTLIEKDLSGVMPAPPQTPVEMEKPLTEEEITAIVSSSEDKYSMVSILHERGCAVDDISRYSGIPIGEVRLVLNLINSR
ncbi:MAG: hypothetical protein A2176_12190 [Spirochaetes bacterium RBG_13_51_14]|nr:MAG: hypothetical protein A2176_12190 [Spirochaetes bacterium RBG_13_51_14]